MFIVTKGPFWVNEIMINHIYLAHPVQGRGGQAWVMYEEITSISSRDSDWGSATLKGSNPNQS